MRWLAYPIVFFALALSLGALIGSFKPNLKHVFLALLALTVFALFALSVVWGVGWGGWGVPRRR